MDNSRKSNQSEDYYERLLRLTTKSCRRQTKNIQTAPDYSSTTKNKQTSPDYSSTTKNIQTATDYSSKTKNIQTAPDYTSATKNIQTAPDYSSTTASVISVIFWTQRDFCIISDCRNSFNNKLKNL